MKNADADDSATEKVAFEIMAYLRAQPAAIDTARGVRDWWLRHLRPRPAPEVVAAALERLAVAGKVRRVVNPAQTELWTAVPPGGDGA